MGKQFGITAAVGALGGVVLLGVVSGGDSPTAVEDCAPPYREQNLINPVLPDGWAVDTAAVVRMEGMVREWDDAPIDILAAWVVDEEGERVTDEVTVWAWVGGSQQEDFGNPMSYLVLSDEAERVLEARLAELDEEARKRVRPLDLREEPRDFVPEAIGEDVEEVRRARECLECTSTVLT